MREQAGEQALVDVDFVGGGVDIAAAAGVNVGGSAHFAQLSKEVPPFADAQVVDVFAVAHLAQLRGDSAACCSLMWSQSIRKEEKSEVSSTKRACIASASARTSAGRSRGSLDGQGCGEHHHFLGASAAAAFDNHAGQARVHRNAAMARPMAVRVALLPRPLRGWRGVR